MTDIEAGWDSGRLVGSPHWVAGHEPPEVLAAMREQELNDKIEELETAQDSEMWDLEEQIRELRSDNDFLEDEVAELRAELQDLLAERECNSCTPLRLDNVSSNVSAGGTR